MLLNIDELSAESDLRPVPVRIRDITLLELPTGASYKVGTSAHPNLQANGVVPAISAASQDMPDHSCMQERLGHSVLPKHPITLNQEFDHR